MASCMEDQRMICPHRRQQESLSSLSGTGLDAFLFKISQLTGAMPWLGQVACHNTLDKFPRDEHQNLSLSTELSGFEAQLENKTLGAKMVVSCSYKRRKDSHRNKSIRSAWITRLHSQHWWWHSNMTAAFRTLVVFIWHSKYMPQP